MKQRKAKTGWVPYDDTDSSRLDWSKGQRAIFPNLKPSTTTVSLRLPSSLLARIKSEANKRDVPYQSYMKVLLANAIADR
ncbi:MAG: BrnA antitoxin family protein [Deltaproteobacteria bacterium]|nr:BrnA antitoxin family protein [Deltaproteobacteria bacterium]